VPLAHKVYLYQLAKEYLCRTGYASEIHCQPAQEFSGFSERELLREAAWVILCTGFKETRVRGSFDFISLCFCDWESAAEICKHASLCRATALTKFGNTKKIDSIISVAQFIQETGFHKFKEFVLSDPIQALQVLPFIGPVTAFHLAKNLGFCTAKPDRHLVRLSRMVGFGDPHQLCAVLSEVTGDPIPLVDTVLWRYIERCRDQQLSLKAAIL
jgi:hypothetical protein